MKKGIVKVAAFVSVLLLAPFGGVLKAESAPEQQMGEITETRTGTVVGVTLSDNVGTYLLRDDLTGLILPADFSGEAIFKTGDAVVYTVTKTTSKVIVRDIIRR